MKRLLQPVLVAAMFVVSVAATDPASRSWNARLTGHAQHPPVTSKATGTARVWLVAFGDSSVHYRVQTSPMTDVTMAHLHSGSATGNGPIIVTLETPKTKGKMMVSEGTFHASDLSGPLAGKGLSDFVASCDSGNVYVNVHTQAHTDGEIRGQLHGGKTTAAKTSSRTRTHTTTHAHTHAHG